MSLILKNQQVLTRAHALAAKFNFQTITETLNLNIFVLFVNIFLILNRTMPQKKIWETNGFKFYFRPQKWENCF